jgi:hypothetical protein
MMGTYCITVKGGSVLHTVRGAMDDHRPWRDKLTTLCGREVVASSYFEDLTGYRASYNTNGKACSQCENILPYMTPLSSAPPLVRAAMIELAERFVNDAHRPCCDGDTTLQDWIDCGYGATVSELYHSQ